MSEVSCRVFEVLLDAYEKRQFGVDELVESTDLGVHDLKDPNRRVTWSTYVQVMHNAGRRLNDENFIEMGESFFESKLVARFALVGRFLFDARDFYPWLCRPTVGPGNQVFSCVEPHAYSIDDTWVGVELRLPLGYPLCRPFFLISQGAFRGLPGLWGGPRAEVEFEMRERTAYYRIAAPLQTSRWVRLRRLVAWPFLARSIAQELEHSVRDLEQRNRVIESSRLALERQAVTLRRANAIHERISHDLDLGRLMAVVVQSLVEVAELAGAELTVRVQVGDSDVERTVGHGDTSGESPVAMELKSAGRPIGVAQLHLRAGVEAPSDLLDLVSPTVASAIANALEHSTVVYFRHTLETRVKDRTAELQRTSDDLSATVVQLTRAREFRDRLIANVHHDLRTPLTAMRLASQQLRTLSERSVEENRVIDRIDRNAQRLNEFVGGILMAADGQAGAEQLAVGAIDARALLAALVEDWRAQLAPAGLTIHLVCNESVWVRANRFALERTLNNLIGNSQKYTSSGGIIVRAALGQDCAVIEVSDTGTGVSPDLLGRMFDRFEKGPAPVRGTERGTGLGLSIVRDLITGMGGTVSASSELGRGTTVRLTLRPETVPAQEPSVAGQPSVAPKAQTEPSTQPVYVLASRPSGAVVMVVEDDEELLHGMRDLLGRHYGLVLAPTAEAALQALQQHVPDVIVTDLRLPGMDGLQLITRIRAQETHQHTPILVVSAHGDIGERLAGLDAGAVDFVVKGYDPAELRARVAGLVRWHMDVERSHERRRLLGLAALSAGLAHELRNPANAIVNAIPPLRKRLPGELLLSNPSIGILLDTVAACASQVANLSEHLVAIGGKRALRREPVRTDDLVRRVEELMHGTLEAVHYERRSTFEGEVWVSGPLLVQAFYSLLDNAVQAVGHGGHVALGAWSEGERWLVDVIDDGPGIEPALRERVFDPFFTTKPPDVGTGLGLYNVRRIVDAHGGTVRILDAERGATFRVELPLGPPSHVESPGGLA